MTQAEPPSSKLLSAECGRTAEDDARGWRVYLVWADTGPKGELVVICPDCAEREQLAERE